MITVINTGGTFNKYYEPISGELKIDSENLALNDIFKRWHIRFEIINILNKDSLNIDNDDRKLLLETIKNIENKKIVVVHGTDTIDISASYIDNANLDKETIFTGAMVPYSINPIEATANFSLAIGYLLALKESGVYISMHGKVDLHKNLKKDKKQGKFLIQN